MVFYITFFHKEKQTSFGVVKLTFEEKNISFHLNKRDPHFLPQDCTSQFFHCYQSILSHCANVGLDLFEHLIKKDKIIWII